MLARVAPGHTPLLVVGGGLGGIAAALAAARRGVRVVLTEEFEWIGGQVTSQAVPPDEHPWIEELGCTRTYRQFRQSVRAYYRSFYPLLPAAASRKDLNPGAGWVSKLCHEPRVALATLEAMLAPHRASGLLSVIQPVRPISCDVAGDAIVAVRFEDLRDGSHFEISCDFVVDATELGDLLPLAGVEYVTGFESREETGEPSAPDVAQSENVQALSICFAMDHVDGDHTIDRPEQYSRWRRYAPKAWGGPLLSWCAPHPRTLQTVERSFNPNPGDDPLAVVADQSVDPGDSNLWTFRRILAKDLHRPGAFPSDITLVNWPAIDYFEAPVIDLPEPVKQRRLFDATQLSLSFLYWMQTEAPRPDGGTGWPGLRLRGDVVGTQHGLAMAPYHREGRRIRALTTVVEQDLSHAVRGEQGARHYPDSVGIGMYRIDLHPSTGGDTYLDVAACPFELPLGALIPQRVTNLLAGCKNIGSTHITNGAYRLHPVEWNAGEVAGALAARCHVSGRVPSQIRRRPDLLEEFQRELRADGVPTQWRPPAHAY